MGGFQGGDRGDAEGRINMNARGRGNLLELSLGAVLLLLFLAALCTGNYRLSPGEAVKIVFGRLTGNTSEKAGESVLLNIRLLRAFLAVAAGASLAVAGSVYQAVFHNRMVSPDLLGVSSAAACGAAAGIELGAAKFSFLTAFLASVAALCLTGLFSTLLRDRKGGLLISGLVVGGFARSLLGLFKYLADAENGELESIIRWELGSLAKASWQDFFIALPLFIAIILVLLLFRRRIGILELEELADLTGVHFGIERAAAVAAASLLVALITSLCGVISWVALVVPMTAAQLRRGDGFAGSVAVSALLGSIFLLGADTAARALTQSEIPISIMTGALGILLFAVSLISGRRNGP